MRIAVVGLGKLGAPLLAVLRSAGHDVVGVDASQDSVRQMQRGVAPVEETGLQELLDQVQGPIVATTSLDEAVARSEAAFVVVPTPSRPEGDFDLKYVLDVVRGIGESLRRRPTARYVVTITSTVMPGSIDGPIRNALEETAGTPLGDRLGLVYNPEFIALGSAISDMRHPDVVLIGETDGWSGAVVEQVQRSYVANEPVVARMSAVNAEVAKLALNTYVTMKISFANMLGEICERLPGGDAPVVAAAVGSDSRVGRKYFEPGGSFGGPCFPRDNRALTALASDLDVTCGLPRATDATNLHQAERLVDRLCGYCSPPGPVAVLGLSYKPDTPVAEESFGSKVAGLLARDGWNVRVHDPQASANAQAILGHGVTFAPLVTEALSGARAVIVATPWREYAALAELMRGVDSPPEVVFDCWNLFATHQIGSALVVRTGQWCTPATEQPVEVGLEQGSTGEDPPVGDEGGET